MNKEITAKIFSDKGYIELLSNQEEIFRYKVIDYLNKVMVDKKTYELPEKLIITYSAARARKDRADRERLNEKNQVSYRR